MTTATEAFGGVCDVDSNHSSFEAGTRHMRVRSFRARFEDVSAGLLIVDG
jgi:polyisoprenoid-binding protein YceI